MTFVIRVAGAFLIGVGVFSFYFDIMDDFHFAKNLVQFQMDWSGMTTGEATLMVFALYVMIPLAGLAMLMWLPTRPAWQRPGHSR